MAYPKATDPDHPSFPPVDTKVAVVALAPDGTRYFATVYIVEDFYENGTLILRPEEEA